MANSLDTIMSVTEADQRRPGASSQNSLRPFFTIDDPNNEADVLGWCRSHRDFSVKYARLRNKNIRVNLELYSAKRGTATIDTQVGAGSRLDGGRLSEEYGYPMVDGVIVNHLYDLTENKVSKFADYQPIVDVSPANSNDPAQRFAASANKDFLDYLRDINPVKEIKATIDRRRIIAGEAYLFVEWDPNKGYLHPEVQQILASGQVPVLPDENSVQTDSDLDLNADAGEPQPADKGASNSPLDMLSELRVGDVSFRVPDTRNIFLEPLVSGEYHNVNYLFERQLRDIDELKAEFPDHAQYLNLNTDKAGPFLYDDGSTEHNRGDLWNSEIISASNQIAVWTLVHKPTKFVKGGRKVVFTDDCLLHNDVDEYYDPTDVRPNNGFPIRITDIDVDGDLYGISVYTQARNLNEFTNKLYTLAYRNQQLVGNPKWFVPENSRVTKESLGNDMTIVRYQGDKKPELEIFSNTPKELFALIQSMEQNQQKMFAVFGISQGEVPAGMEAGIALRYLSEQEKARQNGEAVKQNGFIKTWWEKAMAVARKFYSPTDQRLMKVWGPDKSFEVKTLNPLNLSTPCDLRIDPSSSLSESKAAKVQYLLDINAQKPIPDDAFFENLDLGTPEAFMNEVTYAKKAADLENTFFLVGQPVNPPQASDDHLTHWHRHFIFFQSATSKNLPPDRYQALVDHMGATEQMLMQKAFINNDMAIPANQALAQILLSNPNFPIFFQPNRDMLQMQAAMMTGMAMGMPPPGAAPAGPAGGPPPPPGQPQ